MTQTVCFCGRPDVCFAGGRVSRIACNAVAGSEQRAAGSFAQRPYRCHPYDSAFHRGVLPAFMTLKRAPTSHNFSDEFCHRLTTLGTALRGVRAWHGGRVEPAPKGRRHSPRIFGEAGGARHPRTARPRMPHMPHLPHMPHTHLAHPEPRSAAQCRYSPALKQTGRRRHLGQTRTKPSQNDGALSGTRADTALWPTTDRMGTKVERRACCVAWLSSCLAACHHG